MADNIIKRQYIALQPDGIIGNVLPGSDEDRLYDGLSDDLMVLRDWLDKLSNSRDPDSTQMLVDLEREYGIDANNYTTESDRRNYLRGLVYAKKSGGDKDGLEDALIKSGFTGVKVFDNTPLTDPRTLTGDYVVNGQIGQQHVTWNWTCRESSNPAEFENWITCTEFEPVTCGAVSDIQDSYTYDPQANHNMVFFVCKDIQVTGGAIVQLVPLDVGERSYDNFISIILRYKPLGTWAMVSVNLLAENDVYTDVAGSQNIYTDVEGSPDVYTDEANA